MFKSINYSSWSNPIIKELAQQADQDEVNGLNGIEIFNFAKSASANNIDKSEISALLGLDLSGLNSGMQKLQRERDPIFNKAVDYYNDNMDYSGRYKVTNKTYANLEERLYKMEKSIDQAFIDCAAYHDIVIVPRNYYKFYPYFNDKLVNFNIEEIRNLTSKDMQSLHELKDKIEYIMEDANGETTHHEPSQTEYDIETLALKHLGMSYEEFSAKYSAELEFCKTVTPADFANMTETQRMVYAKAKAYATEMLNTTIMEAHTVNWDTGERKVDETLKATEDMLKISDFEYDGITEDGLAQIESGITDKTFEETLITAYKESGADSAKEINADSTNKNPRKVIENGEVRIYTPDGSVYNSGGVKIK